MPGLPLGGITPVSTLAVEGQHEQPAPAAIIAPLIDPITGEIGSLTRSARLADAFAIEALRVRRGSGAAVEDLGNGLHELGYVSDDLPTLAEADMRRAFADGERAGVLRLESVRATVDPGDGSQGNIDVTYRDSSAPPGAEPLRQRIPL